MPLGVMGLGVADVDGDGLFDDVVVATTDCPMPSGLPLDFLWVKVGNGEGRFANQVPVQLDITGNLAPSDLVLGDFLERLGPALPDFIVANPSSDSYWLVENLGGGTFRSRAAHKPGNCHAWWGMSSIVGGRVNLDEHDDFMGVSGLDVLVFLGDGRGAFTSCCEVEGLRMTLREEDEGPPTFAHGMAIGDLNGGEKPDAAVAIRNSAVDRPEVAVLLGRGDGTFQTPSPTHAYLFSVDGDPEDPSDVAAPVMVVIADLDADGLGDIMTTNHYSDSVSILINQMTISPR
jgi:hypothetical protein